MSPLVSSPKNFITEESAPPRRQVTDRVATSAIQRRHPSTLLVFILLALPAIWVGQLMYTHGVDTPWGDQWDGIQPLFAKMQAGTLGLSDFFAFHNEHRIFFPRLLIFPLALLTHWNVRAEIALIWVLLCVSSLNIWRIALATGFRESRSRVWLLLGANVLLFTPLQWENLLWGFQIGFLLPLATMTALPWAACVVRRPLNFAATLALCLVSTFSIASGFTSWLLAAPLLLLSREKENARTERLAWSIWIAVALASVALYFHGFKRPALHPNELEAIRQPLLACRFMLAYLGNPFAYGTEFDAHVIAQIVGGMLLVLFGGALSYLWRWREDRALVAQSLPWVSLSAIAFFNGALTTFGRIAYGIAGAMQSRYVSFAVMLPIGLIFLAAVVIRHSRTTRHNAAASFGVVGGAFALLLVLSTVHSLRYWEWFHHARLAGKALLVLRDVVNDRAGVTRYIHWNASRVHDWADSVERIGYLRPPRLRSAHIHEIAADNSEAAGVFQKFERSTSGEITASGWAILPWAHRIADCVLLTYETGDGDPIIFARADVRGVRNDVVDQLGDSSYRNSGWSFSFKAPDVPPGATRIAAWAFDVEECRAYPIGAAVL